MKRKQPAFIIFIASLLSLLFFNTCTKQPDKITWSSDSISRAPKDNKLIMIDFYGDNCNPCKQLDLETFSDPRIITFVRRHFYCYKKNAWIEANKELRKKYNIISVPTLVFQTGSGEIIDYLKNFIPPDEFLDELKRIVGGRETYPDLQSKLEKNPENPELIFKVANKMANMGRWKEEFELWERHTRITPPGTANHDYGRLKMAGHKMWLENDTTEIIHLLDSLPNHDFVFRGRSWIWEHLRRKKESAAEADYYHKSMEWFLKNYTDYPGLDVSKTLSAYAWRMGRLGLYLEDALKKNTYALDILPEDYDQHQRARIIDTQAELLWILGRKEEALEAIERSLKLWPERKYFHEQKQKFLTKKFQKKN
jgi:thiol:disulfide interchange protein DsbD